MICPFCNNEMEEGSVNTSKEAMYFTKDNQEKKFGLFVNVVKIKKFFVFSMKGNYCSSCKKIILDTED